VAQNKITNILFQENAFLSKFLSSPNNQLIFDSSFFVLLLKICKKAPLLWRIKIEKKEEDETKTNRPVSVKCQKIIKPIPLIFTIQIKDFQLY
jgi:hypothetical protein